MHLDSVQIGVADLDRATEAYTLVFGQEPLAPSSHVRRFQLLRGAVELEAGALGVHSLCFVPDDGETSAWPSDRASYNGLDIRVAEHATGQSPAATTPGTVHAIDHVVINTPDLDRAIALWRDRLGVRLALDREFPQRGLRMCFFRSAGMTLEFVSTIQPPPNRSGTDIFYGLAYHVTDLPACRARLVQDGVDVSEVRKGNKTGTTVATVRSHTAGVATLLIEEAGR